MKDICHVEDNWIYAAHRGQVGSTKNRSHGEKVQVRFLIELFNSENACLQKGSSIQVEANIPIRDIREGL